MSEEDGFEMITINWSWRGPLPKPDEKDAQELTAYIAFQELHDDLDMDQGIESLSRIR